jgi:hypothetical protein
MSWSGLEEQQLTRLQAVILLKTKGIGGFHILVWKPPETECPGRSNLSPSNTAHDVCYAVHNAY